MQLNAEERMRQAEFKQRQEREQYARPTEEQLEIASLEEQAELAQETINLLNSEIDKLTKQRNQVRYHLSLYDSDERDEEDTLDAVRAVMVW